MDIINSSKNNFSYFSLNSFEILAKRTIRNPTFRAFLLGGATCGSGIYTISGFRENSPQASAMNILMTGLFGLITKMYIDKNYKHLRNEYGLSRNIYNNLFSKEGFPWWNDIIDNKLIVGGLPLVNFGHPQLLSAQKITNIVSVVEEEEFGPKILTVPLRHTPNAHWLHISAGDHGPVDAEKITDAIKWIESKLVQDEKVFVHCKSGKGRSVMVALAFLYFHGSKYDSNVKSIMENPAYITVEAKVAALCAYMKLKRPVAKPGKEQIQAVVDYIKNICCV